jgi:hypothetical protein
MITKKFLIQSSYGYTGPAGHIVMSGIAIWTIDYKRTPESMHEAFIKAQENSSYVESFNVQADAVDFPREYGRWLVFSVIKEF